MLTSQRIFWFAWLWIILGFLFFVVAMFGGGAGPFIISIGLTVVGIALYNVSKRIAKT